MNGVKVIQESLDRTRFILNWFVSDFSDADLCGVGQDGAFFHPTPSSSETDAIPMVLTLYDVDFVAGIEHSERP